MTDFDEMLYARCILLNGTNTKILLIKEYKPLIEKYVLRVPTVLINYHNYDEEIKSWFNKKLAMNVILNSPDDLNILLNPDITNIHSTIVHVFKSAYPFENNRENENILESMWVDFKDISSVFKDPEIYMDEFTHLLLNYYSTQEMLNDKIDKLHDKLAYI